MIWALLILFQAKYFIMEQPLQTPFLFLVRGNKLSDYWMELLLHGLSHGVCTLAICLAVNPQMWWLSLLDTSVHCLVDGSLETVSKNIPKQKLLTFDHLLHHMTHYYIVYILLGGL